MSSWNTPLWLFRNDGLDCGTTEAQGSMDVFARSRVTSMNLGQYLTLQLDAA